ncbi:MAG TPA: tRNA epoxyqueuosine(34) reductase QueG [Fimbriimonadaceae bacterium]|nr:tRNA epoxyqueuosine(34) reductase QueG [Fimbriimonadaceae bacterium]
MAIGTEDLKALARRLGFQSVGVAEARPAQTIDAYIAWVASGMHAEMAYLPNHIVAKRDPSALLRGVRSVIAVALNYGQPNPARAGAPRIARYALGRDYHKVLRGKLRTLARHLGAVHSEASFRICVDSAPLLEREYAQRAGLGWFGKNTCLIDSRSGSWFVLGFLLTTLELEPDVPALGGCGTCRACIDACPTGAIVLSKGRWAVDSRSCISYFTIEKRGAFTEAEAAMVGGWTFGCDVCQEVCPFNQPRDSQPKRALDTVEPDFRATRTWPSLRELAQIREEAWDALTKGSPVRRVGLAGLRRNTQANLANAEKTQAV